MFVVTRELVAPAGSSLCN